MASSREKTGWPLATGQLPRPGAALSATERRLRPPRQRGDERFQRNFDLRDSLCALSPPSPPRLQVVDSSVTSLRNKSARKEHGEKPDWGNCFRDTRSPLAEACPPPASSRLMCVRVWEVGGNCIHAPLQISPRCVLRAPGGVPEDARPWG